MRKHAASFESRVNFIWYNDFSFEDILKHVAALPPHAAVIWITMNVDAAGTVYEGDTAFKRVRAAANAPIFSYQGFLFGRGIVGGPMYSVEAQSQQTASVAIRLLEGGRPADSDLRPMGFAPPRFDWRELQRWGIREHFLPPGSQIDFREPTAWQQYRWHILALIAVMSFQACLIGWLTYEHRRRSVAETESRNAITKLAHMNRIATAGELSASIAHEVNQPLCGITARASAALNWLEAEKPDLDRVRKALAQILKSGDRAGEIVASVRAMFTKGPANQVRIDINKLIQAVLAIVRDELQDNRVTVLLELDGDLPAIKGDHVQLQQVILNLVVNAIEAMHSGQLRMLRIRTELSTPDAIHVAIEDTGTGIDPANTNRVFKALFTTKPAGMGIGLAICRSIITSHAGRIWVSSGTERGSIFHFELPVAPLPTT